MGIYAKNREEWVTVDIGNVQNSVITVAFYDTLGPDAVSFVINQTELTAISCSGNYLPGLIKLRRDNTVKSLQTLISFDQFPEDLKKEAQEVGITLYHYNEILEAGK